MMQSGRPWQFGTSGAAALFFERSQEAGERHQ
jgi:hypothetical protein